MKVCGDQECKECDVVTHSEPSTWIDVTCRNDNKCDGDACDGIDATSVNIRAAKHVKLSLCEVKIEGEPLGL